MALVWDGGRDSEPIEHFEPILGEIATMESAAITVHGITAFQKFPRCDTWRKKQAQ